MRAIDITGQKFGRMTALVLQTPPGVPRRWLCRCDCGAEKTVYQLNLAKGDTTSCGCAQRETLLKHGMARSPTYKSWCNMWARCRNPRQKYYADYGGRGISVCERWRDFANFLADVGGRPTKSHSIERIDTDGNYEPTNCKWATPFEQATNKRMPTNNTSGVVGVTWDNDRHKWLAQIKIGGKGKFLGRFDSIVDAAIVRQKAASEFGFAPDHGEARRENL